jgi:bifunctional DNA-binding transcriptional regulator/antitoxin component of YhaV-PrlF toxin-antitoxin module
MLNSTVTAEGHTTLPREVVEAMSVRPGDRIAWEIHGNFAVIRRADPKPHAGEQQDESGS